jgi:hypothetical protein
MLLYHKLVVEPFRSQAIEAKTALASVLVRQKEPVSSGSEVASETVPAVPLAMNTLPATASGGDPAPSGVPPSALPQSGIPAPAPAAADPQTRGVPAAVQPAAAAVPDTKARLTEAGLLDPPAAGRAPAPPQPDRPATTTAPVAPTADLPPAGTGPLPQVGGSAPADAPGAPLAPAQDVATAERVPAYAPPDSGPSPGPNTEAPALEPAPLPSKEETRRAIEEEAAKKQQEIDAEQNDRDAQVRALRDEQRRQFLDELREILRLHVHDQQAGPEIEKLAVRTGRESDRVTLRRAYGVLYSNRLAQPDKVRRLREIGLPETIILDYLANELNRRIGSRNGPRDRGEVWVRAAQLLLKYDQVPAGPGGAPANRPSRIPAPGGAAARAR